MATTAISGQARAPVRIAAASDLKFALDDIVGLLSKRYPWLQLEPVYGSSGNFHAQLGQRAPFDLYLSADAAYPRDLVARGIGSDRDLFTYAVGGLVVWVPRASRLPIERDGLQALTAAAKVAIANPRHAPYGRAAEAALRHAGLWEQVQPRLVLGDNIVQTAQFVERAGADAGLLAKSLALAPALRDKGRFVEVPADAYPPLVQAGLILPWARSRRGAETLRDFLLGEDGRGALAAYGFAPPPRP